MPPSRSGAAYGKTKAGEQNPASGDQMAHSSLEKRLERAREQRSRIIASREPRDKTNPGLLTAKPASSVKSDKTSTMPPAAEDQAAVQAAPMPDDASAATPPSDATTQSEPQGGATALAATATGWGKMGLVASGCSIGLALGLALGASLTNGTEPLASAEAAVQPQPVALANTTSPDISSPPLLQLTGITEVAAVLPTSVLHLDPVTSTAVPAAPSAAPTSDRAPLVPVAASISAFWEISEPHTPAEIAPIPVAWSAMPAPGRIATPEAPGTFDAAARLAPFEAAPMPPFSLAEDLFAPGSALPQARVFVFAPAALSQNEVSAQVAALAETGLQTANLQRIEMTISTAHVRYYTASDTTVATALAETLGVEARDFTGTVSGEPGHIEVWLAGSSGLPIAPAPTDPTPDNYLFGKIVEIFRR